jgi:hypothetical protein
MGFVAVDPQSLSGIKGFQHQASTSNEAIMSALKKLGKNASADRRWFSQRAGRNALLSSKVFLPR